MMSKSKPKCDAISSHAELPKLVPIVPDGGWGWIVCIASFYCNLIASGIASSFGALFIGILDTFDESASKISFIGSLFTGLVLFCGPFASSLLARFSHRVVIIIGSVVGFCGIFLSVFSLNIEMLIITYGIFGGFFVGLCFFTANVIVGVYFDKRQALAVSLATTGNGAGVFVMNVIIEYLLIQYGLRGTLLVLSAMVLNMAVAGALCRPLSYRKVVGSKDNLCSNSITTSQQLIEQQTDSKSENTKEAYSENKVDETSISLMTDTITEDKEIQVVLVKEKSVYDKFKEKCDTFFDVSILKNTNALMMIIIYFFWSVNLVVLVYLPLYAKSRGYAQTTILVSFSGIGYTAGQFMLGFFIDVLHLKADHMLTFSMMVMGSGCVAIPLASSFYATAIIVVLWSVAGGFCVSLRIILTTLFVGAEKLSSGYSMLSLFLGIGYCIGPPLFGMVYEVTGIFSNIFYGCGIAFYIGGLLAFLVNFFIIKKS